ncbi:MAG: hypothetical protein NTU83_07550 [Candidatus Hydrogenedentes bacterium]|nr:hypothetical protein [Candidatus Hydrogenedentota bacterium]
MAGSIFVRMSAFAKWLLARESLDHLPPQSSSSNAGKTFLGWLISWEPLPFEDSTPAPASANRKFIEMLLARESLPPAGDSKSKPIKPKVHN